jgi:DNA-binding CsgD family transcriptional regulator
LLPNQSLAISLKSCCRVFFVYPSGFGFNAGKEGLYIKQRCRSPPLRSILKTNFKNRTEEKMNKIDFTKLSRKQLLEHFEQERQEWLAAGMSEADIFCIHFGEEHENGRGGDYRVWLNERKHTRPDHKYAPGTPVAIDAVDPHGAWINSGRSGFDDVEFNIDLETALFTLTELQRYCFLEVVLNDRTQQSVADDLGIKQQVVDKHIRGAKNKLKIFFR